MDKIIPEIFAAALTNVDNGMRDARHAINAALVPAFGALHAAGVEPTAAYDVLLPDVQRYAEAVQ